MNTIISTAYLLSGFIVIIFYIPQIKLLWAQTSVQDINQSTWTIFSISSFIASLYAVLVIKDYMFAVVASGHFFGQIIILLISVYKSKNMAY